MFATVLFPASGHGLVRKPLERAVWAVFRIVGRRLGQRNRRNLLSYAGPVEVAATLAVWSVLSLVGWALIYQPALGHAIRATSGPTDTAWTTALYYSGFVVTTLGTGEITPHNGLFRLLTITESLVGFAGMTLVITYFLSIYSNLTSRSVFAQSLEEQTRGTGDAAALIAGLADAPGAPGAHDRLTAMADSLRQINQSHRSYPVLHYFHQRELFQELARVLFVALDTSSLLATVLEPSGADRARRSSVLDGLRRASLSLLATLAPGTASAGSSQEPRGLAEAWAARYAQAHEQLAGAGVAVRGDAVAGAQEYVEHRRSWDGRLRELAAAMLCDWDSVESTSNRGSGREPVGRDTEGGSRAPR